MPEGDTVFRAAAALHRGLADVPITECELRWGSRSVPDVIGARTVEVVARGKHLLHRIEGGLTIHSHLRMEGSWRVRERAAVTPAMRRDRRLRAVVGTDEQVALGMRLGMFEALRTRDEPRIVGHLGPDILGTDWDRDRALANLADDDHEIGAALLDQRNLAGIGTMYAAESLFIERVNPWARVDVLDDEVVAAVVDRAVLLLHDNVAHAIQSTTGDRRRGAEKFVHGRAGHACRRCASAIRVAPIGHGTTERVMFYCPTCQPADR